MLKALKSARSIVAVTTSLGIKCWNLTVMLRIIGAAAMILASVVFVSIARGARNHDRVETFLSSPRIMERFREMERDRSKVAKDQAWPLVTQAEAFARYLNPKPETPKPLPAHKVEVASAGASPLKPDFKVLGTSFCEGNTDNSLVFIDEPGKGRRWHRQSDRVGDFLIEQIGDGLIVVKKDETTFELELEQRPQPIHPKEVFGVSAKSVDTGLSESGLSSSDETAYVVPQTAIEVSVAYNSVEPMWGEDGSYGRMLSYAASAK